MQYYDQQKPNANMANKARQAPVATPYAGFVEKIAGCTDLILTWVKFTLISNI